MDILLDTLMFGIPYAILALGVFISYRVLDFADLSCEGTYVLGAATSLVMISNGANPWLATIIGFLAGCIGGLLTGTLNTKLKINGLLAGIITLTACFSVNLVIFGITKGESFSWKDTYNSFRTLKITAGNDPTIFSWFGGLFSIRKYGLILELVLILGVVISLLYALFGTEVGMSMRAAGMNKKMARSQGINTDFYVILGLVISNGLIALAGSLGAQRDFTVSSVSGTGMIVIGLASIIIGEALFGKRTFLNWLISVACGAIVYYLIIAIALYLGFPSHLLKLLYAILIVIILAIGFLKEKYNIQFIKWIKNKLYSKKAIAQAQKNIEEANEAVVPVTEREISYEFLPFDEIPNENIVKENDSYIINGNILVDDLYNSLGLGENPISLKNGKHDKTLSDWDVFNGDELNSIGKIIKVPTSFERKNKISNTFGKFNKNLVFEVTKVSDNKVLEVKLTLEDQIMLETLDVVKVFNRSGNAEDLKIALNELSVKINDGDFVTIIGGNGSGKSTFFNTVSGVYTTDNGSIQIGGEDVTKMKEYKRSAFIGKVAQDPYQGTAQNMSILENMSIAYRRDRMKTLKWGFNNKNTQMFKEKLKELNLGLENRINTKIGLLSGGQRQAVTLLMATLERPDVLFLDEHTAALDPKTAKTVLELTNEIVAENHLTCVMVTHNMKDAIKYGNRLLMFNSGKIIYDVSGEEKKNLTVEDLLKKFENVEFTDKDILG